MKKQPVLDLHCDLLGTIDWSNDSLDFESPETNCSIPQLESGGVRLQVLAIAGVTGVSKTPFFSGKRQVELYQQMLHEYPDKIGDFASFNKTSNKIHCLFAIENASLLAEETDPLEKVFERLKQYQGIERILYLSLTWNHKNRFGGGNLSDVGLKDDGKELLEVMNEMGIAIDFSHTCDRLAYDIISYIDKKGLTLPLMASHSNFRAIKDHPRNLPDEIAKEIVLRGGVIGVNFVQRFLGKEPESLIDHIEYGLSLGRQSLGLGADFYGALEVPDQLSPAKVIPPFFDKLPNASSYPILRSMLSRRISEKDIEGLFWENGFQFITKALTSH